MFFPIRTDRRLKRTPWVNYTLIALNIAVYAFTWQSTQQFAVNSEGGYSIPESFEKSPGVGLWLWPDDADNTNIRLYQFVTYQFVHSGPEPIPFFNLNLPLHLIFNMLFLFVFGNAVEDRLGKLPYLGFYLAGGILAGLAHITIGVSPGPVLGASGAVAGVTGAYLALFPLSNVTIAYWLIVLVGSFEVSSMMLILFRVTLDVIFQFGGIGNTAYVAHLAGYTYGFAVGMLLLLTRLLPRENYDMLALFEQQRRRRQFRKMARDGFRPWDHENDDRPGQSAPTTQESDLLDRRSAVQAALLSADLPRAATLYRQLLVEHPEQVLAEQAQLDIATQLASEQRYDVAARAYELFLHRYPAYPQRPQVQLILGLIYVNYLDQPGRGRELLSEARPRLDESERSLADRTLQRIGG